VRRPKDAIPRNSAEEISHAYLPNLENQRINRLDNPFASANMPTLYRYCRDERVQVSEPLMMSEVAKTDGERLLIVMQSLLLQSGCGQDDSQQKAISGLHRFVWKASRPSQLM
jgi:hypothetical protein